MDSVQKNRAANTRELSLPFDRVAGKRDIEMIWAEGAERDLPIGLVVEGDAERDFLSWCWTYIPELRPITAYIRLLSEGDLIKYSRLTPCEVVAPSLGKYDSACLGLVLGEAATWISGRLNLKMLHFATCASTFSYAMSRALALGESPQRLPELSSRWDYARRITDQPKFMLGIDQLEAAWAVLLALHSPADSLASSRDLTTIISACRSIELTGVIDREIWGRFTSLAPTVKAPWLIASEPREGRVLALEVAIAEACARPKEGLLQGFLLGFLASLISPGTLDHMPLLSEIVADFPSVLLWQGLCAGLQKPSGLYGFGGGLGRRLMRELLRAESIENRPRCDIALQELDMLIGADSAGDFRTAGTSQLEVELLPMVNTILRWPPRDRRSNVTNSNPSVPVPSARGGAIDQSLFEEINDLVAAAQRLQKRLGASSNLQSNRPKPPQKKRRAT